MIHHLINSQNFFKKIQQIFRQQQILKLKNTSLPCPILTVFGLSYLGIVIVIGVVIGIGVVIVIGVVIGKGIGVVICIGVGIGVGAMLLVLMLVISLLAARKFYPRTAKTIFYKYWYVSKNV